MSRLLLALLLLLAVTARAEERILDYAVEIAVAADGALTVTEAITVEVENQQIRHGILRDIPTRQRDAQGRSLRMPLSVQAVQRDGQPEPYDLQGVPDGLRIRIGNPKELVPPGARTYRITYRTGPQIRDLGDVDELYWNATGNFWTFPIDRASARVTLPEGARILRSAFYTGPAGARGGTGRSRQLSARDILFETTAPLGVAEGLTIAVGFGKGAVALRSGPTSIAEAVLADPPLLLAGAGALLLPLYFLGVWWWRGRDPRPGIVIPRFAPPEGMGPASVGCLWQLGYDKSLHAATVVFLAVKGLLTIDRSAKTYRLDRTARPLEAAALPPAEAAMAASLFEGRQAVRFQSVDAKPLRKSAIALRKRILAEARPAWFSLNRPWLWLGAGLGFGLVVGIEFLLERDGQPVDGWLSTMSVVALGVLGSAPLAHSGRSIMRRLLLGQLGALLFLAIAGGMTVASKWQELALLFTTPERQAGVALAVWAFVLVLVFSLLLPALTPRGARLREEVEGFRLFLAVGEIERLRALHPPQVTPAVFERFLPYAIALECEVEWARQFETALAAAGGEADYSPDWMTGGDGKSSENASGFAGALGSSLAAQAAAAGGDVGTGGSDGGGSSGGGGGGGGSGW